MLYDRLKEKESQIKELTNLGLVNPVWLRNIEIFEFYQDEIEKGVGVYDAYYIVAEKIKPQVSWQSVKKIVTDLSK
jgi:hypothetical protein